MPIRKKESNLPRIISCALIGLIMITSVFWFALSFSAGGGSVESGGTEFFRTQFGTIAADFDGKIFEFTYLPREVAHLDLGEVTGLLASSGMSYMTSDPDGSFPELTSITIFDAARALAEKHNHVVRTAFTAENEYGLPVVTCLNATPGVPVVLFNFTNSTDPVKVNGSCAVVSFDSEDSLRRLHDGLVYELMGVAQ